MAGYLGNSFLPARAGEVRSYIINSRSSLTKTYVFTTALSERMMDASCSCWPVRCSVGSQS